MRANEARAALLGARLGWLAGKALGDSRADVGKWGQDSHEGQRTALDDCLAIDGDHERAVRTRLELGVYVEFATQQRCRPGSVQSGDSVDAATDDDAHGE